MKHFLYIFFALLHFGVSAQNLVPNASFENYYSLPCTDVQDSADFSKYLTDWFIPTEGSSDVFSNQVNQNCSMYCCSQKGYGFQSARSGNIYTGIYTFASVATTNDYREYLSIKLKKTLTIGKSYYCEMYVSLADNAYLYMNNMGMFFSTKRIASYVDSTNPTFTYQTLLERTPQIVDTIPIYDRDNWVKVSGIFTADSAYKFLTLGNFYSISNNKILGSVGSPNSFAYYFIDDIAVLPPCGIVNNDTTICLGDKMALRSNKRCDSLPVAWANANNPSIIISNQKSLIISPTDTTTYLHYSANDTQSVTVNVVPNVPSNGNILRVICENGFTTVSLPNDDYNYLWFDGDTSLERSFYQPGSYPIKKSSSFCYIYDTLKITQQKLSISQDHPFCLGDSVLLTSSIKNALSYLWNTGDTTATIYTTKEGNYSLDIKTDSCESLNATFVLKAKNCGKPEFELPNIFTPNSDNINDSFLILKISQAGLLEKFEIVIYNRQGRIVFQSTNVDFEWDGSFNGKPLSDGVYFYVIDFSSQGRMQRKKGSVHLNK